MNSTAYAIYGTDLVPHSYSPGYVLLSLMVSLLGTWTTVELLQRRSSIRGLYNWYLLFGAAVAMGAVAIWSMHYIGNQAIIMGDGTRNIQIVYNPTYTAISFVLPIVIVGVAFLIFSYSEQITYWRIALGGLTAGAAICGMHYLASGTDQHIHAWCSLVKQKLMASQGQTGIANYNNLFDIGHVIGSAVIAVCAANVSLGLFFRFKSAWTASVYARILCAMLLAGTVSSMHWVAAVGTQYQAKQIYNNNDAGLSRSTAGWICGLLALGCCIVLFTLGIIWQRYLRKANDRAKEVVVAAAHFDADGRLLLTAGNMIPCQKITNTYADWEEEFLPGHPVFCWMFRIARAWWSVKDLIPGMRTHLAHLETERRSQSVNDRNGLFDQAQTFKENFCVAAQDLALSMNLPVENLGVLYDRIVNTATITRRRLPRMFSPVPTTGSIRDVEIAQPGSIGRGQILFLVRHPSRAECADLQAGGYRFAPIRSVAENLARFLQVTIEELMPHLDSMQRYKPELQTLNPGVHFAVFSVRPNVTRGFDILARKDNSNLLPSIQLGSLEKLERWQTEFILRYDDWKAGDLLKHWGTQVGNDSVPINQRNFMNEIMTAMNYLAVRVGEDMFLNAVLTSRPYRGPCIASVDAGGEPVHAMVYAFRVLADIHRRQAPNALDCFIPQSLFVTQQRVYPNSPDHARFASKVHQEFAGVEAGQQVPAGERRQSRSHARHLGDKVRANLRWSFHSHGDEIVHANTGDASSEKHLVSHQGTNPFGGILVSNEVSVFVTERRSGDVTHETFELNELGRRNEVAVEASPEERECFADELMRLTLMDHLEHHSQPARGEYARA